MHCRAVLSGCRRSAFKLHSLTPVACLSSASVTGCGVFPQWLVILKHLYVFDTFFNKKVRTTSNFLWRYKEQEVVGCYLKYCLSPEQAQCEIKCTIWMQTGSAWSFAKGMCELQYWKTYLCRCGHREGFQHLSVFVPYQNLLAVYIDYLCGTEQSAEISGPLARLA